MASDSRMGHPVTLRICFYRQLCLAVARMGAVPTASDMTSSLFRAVVAVLGLWAGGLCARIAMPEQTKRADEADTLELYETNAATSVTGEFRSSLATFL